MKIINFQFDVEEIHQNRNLLREMLKSLIKNNQEDFIHLTAQANESLYDEPLLYYHLLEKPKHYPIEQILSGYLSHSPALEQIIVPVVPDKNHVVYIPEKGYFDITQQPFAHIHLGTSAKNGQVPVFKDRQFAMHTGIEFYQFIPEIIIDLDPSANYLPKMLLSANAALVQQALGHIKNNNPDLFELINLCTKNICLFKSDTLNSFAAITHQGTCFINVVAEAPSEVFFIDDLAHQCGHNIFNILTVKTEDFLNIPKGTLLTEISDNSTDERTIYSVFHGLFTYSCILDALDIYLQNGSFGDNTVNQKEAQGRLGFYLIKMFRDLENLYGKNLFTALGESYYKYFITNYQYVFDKYYETTKKFKYEEQPYVFCFKQFLNENGL